MINIYRSTDQENEPNLHLLPCTIESDGDAKVDQYFIPQIRDNESSKYSGHLTAAFRGRPLDGKKIAIPNGYTGHIMKEFNKSYSEEEERHMKVGRDFKEFTYWNLDAEPSANDKLLQAFSWLDVAKAIHTPIDEESSQRSITGK